MDTIQKRLVGKVAIVTGVGSGIGKGCAELFAQHGALVVGCDIDEKSGARTISAIQETGCEVIGVYPCDLTKEDDCQKLVERTIEHFGRLDIVINAGAFGVFKWIEEMSLSDWQATLRGELDLVFLLCRAAWPHLKRQGGSIVNFASANAYQALTGSAALAHCAGKGGVLAMTRQLALEGAEYGIRANSISPGLVATGATAGPLQDPTFVNTVLAGKMIKRLGKPEDIAYCALYLASDESTWVTAADFCVDGGATKFT